MNMRELFRSEYPPSPDEFKEMWKTGTFVFDTNVLLNLYVYSEPTRERFFELIQRLDKQVWLPYQVASEYHRRRMDVVNHEVEEFDNILVAFQKLLSAMDQIGRERQARAELDKIFQPLGRAVRKAINGVEKAKKNHPDFRLNDPIRDQITSLIPSIALPFTEAEYEELFKAGEQRYQNKIPPGFMDADKPVPERYGDYLIWSEIIRHAQETKVPHILITDDRKEDWWWVDKKRNILGPRRELRAELIGKANVDFYCYTPDKFLEFGKEYLDIQQTEETIEEVREVQRRVSFDYTTPAEWFQQNYNPLAQQPQDENTWQFVSPYSIKSPWDSQPVDSRTLWDIHQKAAEVTLNAGVQELAERYKKALYRLPDLERTFDKLIEIDPTARIKDLIEKLGQSQFPIPDLDSKLALLSEYDPTARIRDIADEAVKRLNDFKQLLGDLHDPYAEALKSLQGPTVSQIKEIIQRSPDNKDQA